MILYSFVIKMLILFKIVILVPNIYICIITEAVLNLYENECFSIPLFLKCLFY